MSEDKVYKDGDVVWVKLGNNWWPGEVTDVQRQPEGLLQHLKKKPYCVVKFFEEDAYEYVKSAKQIFPFQCQKKDDFIKKGLTLYNAKNKFMEKFPADVKIAENLTRKTLETKAAPIDNIIINNRPDSIVKAILGQTIVRDKYYDKSLTPRSGTSGISGIIGNNRRESITILNISANSAKNAATNLSSSSSTGNTQNDKNATSNKFIPPTSRLSTFNSSVYTCNWCDFTSTRQNVMIFHRKTHSSSNVSTVTTKSTNDNNVIKIDTTKVATTATTATATTVSTPTTTPTTTPTKDEVIKEIDEIKIKSPAVSKFSTVTNSTPNVADAGGIVDDKTTRLTVKSKNRRGRIARRSSRRILKSNTPTSTKTTPTTKTNTICEDNDGALSDDLSSICTNSTSLSANNSNIEKTRSSSQLTNSNASITTPTSKGNSEDLRQRLLADWSDEDNIDGEHHQHKQEKKSRIVVGDKKDDEDDVTATKSKLTPTLQQTSISSTDDKNYKNDNNNDKDSKSLTRIRNIPKKDRRDVILTEFNNKRMTSVQTTNSFSPAADKNVIDQVSTTLNVEVETNEKLTTDVIPIESNKEQTTTPTAATDVKPTKMSCFDFDDEDEEKTNDALSTIGNFKKKLLNTPDKETTTNNTQHELRAEEFNRKDDELTAEIENLLEQTHATITDVNALQNVTNTTHTLKKDDIVNSSSVKGLPIKERGKRIFKSRNHVCGNGEQLLASSKTNVEQKQQLNESEEEQAQTNIANGTSGKEDVSKESAENATIMAKNVGEAEVEDLILAEEQGEDEEAVIAAVKHSPLEIYRSITPCTSKFTTDIIDENSSVSEADAVFGSPTSMLEEERLAIVEQVQNSEAPQEDEDEIESPPVEEFSGSELEAELQKARKRILTKKQRTPTPKKQQSKLLYENHKTKTENNAETIDNSLNNSSKRRSHLKLTSCVDENESIKNDVHKTAEQKSDTNSHHQIKECEIILTRTRLHKENNDIKVLEEEKLKRCEVKLNSEKLPIRVDKKEEIQIKEKEEESAVGLETKCKVLLRKTKMPIITKKIATTEPEVPEQKPNEHSEDKDIENNKVNNDKKPKNLAIETNQKSKSNNKTLGLTTKRKLPPEPPTPITTTTTDSVDKIISTNGNNDKKKKTETIEEKVVITTHKQQKKIVSTNKIKSLAAAATGGRKQSGHSINLQKDYKLQPKMLDNRKRKVAGNETELEEVINSKQLKATNNTTNATKVQKRKSVSQERTQNLVETLKEAEENKELFSAEAEKTLVMEENIATDVQQPATLASFNLDEPQVVQLQSEEQTVEPAAKILAVPTQPLAGYNETFLLCTLVNNQYKPIDNIPLYLDHDLNQLVPVPVEALEGQPSLIVNPTPTVDNSNNTGIQETPIIKNLLIADEDYVPCEKNKKLLGRGDTNVSDMMAEAAAAAVSTVMTPALVHGNQSNLQFPTNLPTNNAAEVHQTIMLLPEGEEHVTAAGLAGVADVNNEIVADNAIILTIEGQQIIIDAATFAQLLANPDANTQLITDEGTEFVLTREVLAALEAQHEAQQAQALIGDNASTDILAVALAGSDLYGSDILEIETSQGLQLVCSDGNLAFQPGTHLTPPITAQTSETNALLDQTPIMSTLEVPTSTSLAAVSAAAKLKSRNMSPSSTADLFVAAVDDRTTPPNLEDSLAVIGVTTQPSTIPTSLELPITVTNPDIAPKVSLPNVLHVPDTIMQFPVQTSVGVVADGTHMYSDTGS